ncbi:hypothetical protein GC173_08500 [bacterium]|nr:hypothetical protein [bacterium]
MTPEMRAAWRERRDNPLIAYLDPRRTVLGWLCRRGCEALGILGTLALVAFCWIRPDHWLFHDDDVGGFIIAATILGLPLLVLFMFPRPWEHDRLRELRLSLLSRESIALGFFYWPVRNVAWLSVGCASLLSLVAFRAREMPLILPLRWPFFFLVGMCYGLMCIQVASGRSLARWLSMFWLPGIGLVLWLLLMFFMLLVRESDSVGWMWGLAIITGLGASAALWLGTMLRTGGEIILHRADPEAHLRGNWIRPPRLEPRVNVFQFLGAPVFVGALRLVMAYFGVLLVTLALIKLGQSRVTDPGNLNVALRSEFFAALIILLVTVPLRLGISLVIANRFLGGVPLRSGAFQSSLFVLLLPLVAVDTAVIVLLSLRMDIGNDLVEWLAIWGLLLFPLAGYPATALPLAIGAGRSIRAWLAMGLIPVTSLVLFVIWPGKHDFAPDSGIGPAFCFCACFWTANVLLISYWPLVTWCHRRVMHPVPLGRLTTDPDRSGPHVPDQVVDQFALRG